MSILSKKNVEELLHEEITDEMYERALESAKRKQERLYQRYQTAYTLEEWYLLQLIKEAVVEQAFSDFTIALCTSLHDMEKEHLSRKDIGAPTANHIVAVCE